MADPASDEVIGSQEACEILGVAPGQIDVLVEQGLLSPVDDGSGGKGFTRAEVEAARLQGG